MGAVTQAIRDVSGRTDVVQGHWGQSVASNNRLESNELLKLRSRNCAGVH